MKTIIPSNQIRTAEPCAIIKSVGIKSIIAGLTNGTNSIVAWLGSKTIELSGSTLNIYPFVGVVDNTAILIGDIENRDQVAIRVDLDNVHQVNYVYLHYNWSNNCSSHKEAEIIVDVNEHTDSSSLLLATYIPNEALYVEPSIIENLETQIVNSMFQLQDQINDIYQRLDGIYHQPWDSILLKDQSTGATYKLYIDNGEVVYEKV
jgi:hypothetical protein